MRFLKTVLSSEKQKIFENKEELFFTDNC